MKKTYLLAFAIFLIGTTSSVFAATASFSDVGSSNPYLTAIMALKEKGILNGYSDNTFRPGNSLNRAEALKAIIASMNIQFTTDQTSMSSTGTQLINSSALKNCFSDVQEQWFAPYICYAKSKNWINGYADGSFKPGQMVSRVEGLKMLLAPTFDLSNLTVKTSVYTDVDTGAWYGKYAIAAETMGLFEPIAGASYHPGDLMLRGVFSENLYRAMNVANDKGQIALNRWICTAYVKDSYNQQTTPWTTVEPLLVTELKNQGLVVPSSEILQKIATYDLISKSLSKETPQQTCSKVGM